MKGYLVVLKDLLDKQIESTFCETNGDVANLITHLDVKRYSIEKVEVVDRFYKDYKDFCKTDKNLEIGGNVND